jgi:HPt (histidine-containing phosphotransfer) domain-containing protein
MEPLEATVPEIVEQLVRSARAGIERIDAAFAADDLRAVAHAAHAVRNDALMFSASALLEALDALEQAARRDERAPTARALRQVHEIWPGVEAELTRLARGSG